MSRDSLLCVREVAEQLNISDRHVRRLVWGHHIEHHRIGNAIRISPKALEKYLDSVKMEAVVW